MKIATTPVFVTSEEIVRPRCISCEQVAATIELTFPDSEVFAVCAMCTPLDVLMTSPRPETIVMEGPSS